MIRPNKNKYQMSDFFTVLLGSILIVIIIMLFMESRKEIQANQELDIFYMYGDKNGTYWLEPEAEYENIIYIPSSSLAEWDITPTQMGERYKATFDSTGWEVLTIHNKEENNNDNR